MRDVIACSTHILHVEEILAYMVPDGRVVLGQYVVLPSAYLAVRRERLRLDAAHLWVWRLACPACSDVKAVRPGERGICTAPCLEQ